VPSTPGLDPCTRLAPLCILSASFLCPSILLGSAGWLPGPSAHLAWPQTHPARRHVPHAQLRSDLACWKARVGQREGGGAGVLGTVLRGSHRRDVGSRQTRRGCASLVILGVWLCVPRLLGASWPSWSVLRSRHTFPAGLEGTLLPSHTLYTIHPASGRGGSQEGGLGPGSTATQVGRAAAGRWACGGSRLSDDAAAAQHPMGQLGLPPLGCSSSALVEDLDTPSPGRQ
jgi:hypothetical protein